MKLKKPEIRPQKDGDGKVKRMFRRNQMIITTLAIMIAAAGYLNYAGKKELEASTDKGNQIYQAGSLDISDEDLLAENQLAENQLAGDKNGQNGDNLQPQAEGSLLQAEAGGEQTDGSGNSGADTDTAGTQLAEIDSWDAEESGLENPGEAVLTSGITVSDYIAGVQMNREQIRAKNKETLNSIINNANIAESAKQEAIQNMIQMTAIAEKENATETLLQARGFADPVVSITDGKVDVVINAPSITDQQRAQIEDIVKRKTEVPVDGIVITLMKLEE
ncbi:SpoIIIAH-like family protein [Brotaphodocola catenula]|uniref:SpoIIIAH-like family protein n=1 Tax=Brotaphodocola catenula TaxID=2885361 RepID=A0AAE3DH70_9FIRM|nr:SpoIIIAH-like family protein [Brotaphodocola catenula]MCC2163530.1 SpoIIIAH-like family protein [Brotaphodocola catenula]